MNAKADKADSDTAPWILMAIETDLKGEREPIALVRTPEGDKRVPLSETKGKVNIFEQLPDCKKQELARKLLEWYREWKVEQEHISAEQKEDK